MKEVFCRTIVPSTPVSEVRLPPTPGRIFRVTAGLADWTLEEREWLARHPGLIAYQDQLQATFEDVQRELHPSPIGGEEEISEIEPIAAATFRI